MNKPISVSCRPDILLRYEELARERPNELALIFQREPFVGHKRTWGDLLERSQVLARSLKALGATEGSRCAFTLADHPDVLPALMALWSVGATAVLLDKTWGSRRRESVAKHGGATLSVTFEPKTEFERCHFGVDEAALAPLPPGTALLGYTSGSTGDPKGVAFTHQKLGLCMQAASAAMTIRRGSTPRRIACSMRLSGSGVLNLHYTWAAYSAAAVVVLPELSFDTAKSYWSHVESHRVEQTFLVPTLIELINHLAAPRPGEGTPPTCLTGSAPLSVRTQERFQQRFGLPLLNAYGLSETMCASFFGHAAAGQLATNSVGQPWLLNARLKGADGRVIEGPGEGSIELSGPTLFDGYYANPRATAEAFDLHWFKTGDVARRDEAGQYTLVGRTKDVVMKGGYSVYLNEVDEAALSIDGVIEAAAVLALLPMGGEDIGLVVRLAPGSTLTDDSILNALKQDLGHQRAPFRLIRVTEPLPRTGQDKLDRKAIGALWQTRTAPPAKPHSTN